MGIAGHGFDRQRETIEAYARQSGIQIVRWYEEQISGLITISGMYFPEGRGKSRRRDGQGGRIGQIAIEGHIGE